MKSIFTGVLIWIIGLPGAIAQPQPAGFLSEQPKYKELISTLKARSYPSDVEKLKTIAHKTHQKFLKTYRAYAQVSDAFESGEYDCLSGTYLFGETLNALDMRFRIMETNYHIFLLVNTTEGEVLLESTDSRQGIVVHPDAIQARITSYQSQDPVGGSLYLAGIQFYHELAFSQLPGLLYFNRAISAFHRNDLPQSCRDLQKAWAIYDHLRIEEFIPILIHTISASTLDVGEKASLTRLLENHYRESYRTMAGN